MNTKDVISNAEIPKSFLPLSPGVKSGQFVFISEQASVDMEGNIVQGTFEEECRRSFENLKTVLQSADLDMKDVVQMRNYVGKQEYLLAFNEIYKEYFQAPYPARTTLMGCLGSVLKFEVDAVASY